MDTHTDTATDVKIVGNAVRLAWWEGRTKVYTEYLFKSAPTPQNVADSIALARG